MSSAAHLGLLREQGTQLESRKNGDLMRPTKASRGHVFCPVKSALRGVPERLSYLPGHTLFGWSQRSLTLAIFGRARSNPR